MTHKINLKNIYTQIFLGTGLVGLSVFFYSLHYKIFEDSRHIFVFLLSDIAFVPIEVLLVSGVIHQLLAMQEKSSRTKKISMLAGVFFDKVGKDLLRCFSQQDPNIAKIYDNLIINQSWTKSEYFSTKKILDAHEYSINITPEFLTETKNLLLENKNFLIMLLSNPVLTKHEEFTDLLLATFHLSEELSHRKDFQNNPKTDINHLEIDTKRVYTSIVSLWLGYMYYLSNEYPYLFYLAIRTNPFNPQSDAEIKA